MALITAAEARDYIPGLTSTGEDTTLDKYILRADALMAAWCGYPAISATTAPTFEDVSYTHYFDGADGPALSLRVSPVQSITTAKTDSLGTWGYDTTIASGDRTLDALEGVLYINPDASEGWLTGLRAIEVVYVAGYSTIPEWLKSACGIYVANMWRLRKERGKTSVSAGGMNVNTRDEAMPAEVKQILAPHRLIEAFIG